MRKKRNVRSWKKKKTNKQTKISNCRISKVQFLSPPWVCWSSKWFKAKETFHIASQEVDTDTTNEILNIGAQDIFTRVSSSARNVLSRFFGNSLNISGKRLDLVGKCAKARRRGAGRDEEMKNLSVTARTCVRRVTYINNKLLIHSRLEGRKGKKGNYRTPLSSRKFSSSRFLK